jgi:hypothetical protein
MIAGGLARLQVTMDNGPERSGRYTQFFGSKLVTIVTALECAKSITWKGMYPIVERSWKVYQRGVALHKRAMQAVEAHQVRHPEVPKWDTLILPTII